MPEKKCNHGTYTVYEDKLNKVLHLFFFCLFRFQSFACRSDRIMIPRRPQRAKHGYNRSLCYIELQASYLRQKFYFLFIL